MSTLKEVLSNFKKELGNTLQAQKNIIDVTQKYIGLLEDAEGGGSGGGIDYSTEEQDTGIKWIDGKTVYQKTINVGTGANIPIDYSVSSLNIDNCIECYGICARGTIPAFVVDTAYSLSCIYSKSSSQIQIRKGNSVSLTGDIYVTIKYTKAT